MDVGCEDAGVGGVDEIVAADASVGCVGEVAAVDADDAAAHVRSRWCGDDVADFRVPGLVVEPQRVAPGCGGLRVTRLQINILADVVAANAEDLHLVGVVA